MRRDVVVPFLLGAIVTLLAVLVFAPGRQVDSGTARAADSGSASGLIALTSGSNSLFLIDAVNRRVAFYAIDKDGAMRLMSARNVTYDLKVDTELGSKRGLLFKDIRELYRD